MKVIAAFGSQQAQALAPPFLWKNFLLPKCFDRKLQFASSMWSFASCLESRRFETQFKILKFLSMNYSLSFNQCLISHRTSIVINMFRFSTFILFQKCYVEGKMSAAIILLRHIMFNQITVTIMSLNFQNIYENYEFIAL